MIILCPEGVEPPATPSPNKKSCGLKCWLHSHFLPRGQCGSGRVIKRNFTAETPGKHHLYQVIKVTSTHSLGQQVP